LFANRKHPVVGIDRDLNHMGDLSTRKDIELINFDLENGGQLPVRRRKFAAIVLIYYVHRPLFSELMALLEPGGLFLCETFAHGDEFYNSPHNTDHLLANGELLEIFQGSLQIISYEHGLVESPFPGRPFPGIVQRLCATNDRTVNDDGTATAPPRALEP
jgi:SAM-dependent methyltransferase